MASYSIINIGQNDATIRVRPSSPYTSYRVIVRKSSSSSAIVYDEWFDGMSYTFDAYVDGLNPGTSYTVNVGYAMSSGSGVEDYIGAEEFTTDEEPVTYYARLEYDPNGGSGGPSMDYGESDSDFVSFTISNKEPTRDGFIFMGWAYYPDDTEAIIFGGDIFDTRNSSTSYPGPITTIYAVWIEEETGGFVYISNGSSFRAHAPYVYSGGTWRRATPYIYRGGWQKC